MKHVALCLDVMGAEFYLLCAQHIVINFQKYQIIKVSGQPAGKTVAITTARRKVVTDENSYRNGQQIKTKLMKQSERTNIRSTHTAEN